MSNELNFDENNEPDTPSSKEAEVATVARSVLTAYFDKLTATDGFADIAPKLRKAVLEDGQFSDAAIKAVLFHDGA